MASYPKLKINRAQIEAGIERAAQALSHDVVRIRYSLEDDWTGDPSIFFRVVITDEASRVKSLGELAHSIDRRIEKEVDPLELGLNPYSNFRSLSETLEMKEAEWD